eukprot:SAG11_NODE_8362_length_1024_cov_1.505946_2_plen_141_part_00
MEDEVVIKLDLNRVIAEDMGASPTNDPNPAALAFFAVYDGHGGAKCAKYAARHLVRPAIALGRTRRWHKGRKGTRGVPCAHTIQQSLAPRVAPQCTTISHSKQSETGNGQDAPLLILYLPLSSSYSRHSTEPNAFICRLA